MFNQNLSLEEHKISFKRKKLIASPIAGLIAWCIIGILSLYLPSKYMDWVIYIATGSIVYLAMIISKFTGENYLEKKRIKNSFDDLFFLTVSQSILVYAIAIPFYMENPSSLPLSVGILSGIMWMPLSWIINHWIGIFHALSRTISILVLWYLFPDYRYFFIPLAICVIYCISIFFLVKRYNQFNKST